MSQKKGLGMGLNALIPQMNEAPEEPQADTGITFLKLSNIEPNREQPRQTFDEESLAELADSISNYGILQPIIVRKNQGYYEIVTGERRWRAARIAGLTEVPAIIRDYDEQKALEVALIENLQRENLNCIEEAQTYKRLQDEFNLTQDAIAERVGKKRPTVTNALRMLSLSKKVRDLLVSNQITAGHAKALLAVNDHDTQDIMADKIIEMDLSVRQAEKLMKKVVDEKEPREVKTIDGINSIYYKSIESELNTLLSTKVKILNGKNKGKIEIEYFSDDDLNRIIELFKRLGG